MHVRRGLSLHRGCDAKNLPLDGRAQVLMGGVPPVRQAIPLITSLHTPDITYGITQVTGFTGVRDVWTLAWF